MSRSNGAVEQPVAADGLLRGPPLNRSVMLKMKRFSIKEKRMENSKEILKKAMELPPSERAEFVDKLLSSLDEPDRDIDELWAKEAEDRIEAYEKGKLRDLSIMEVLEKYR